MPAICISARPVAGLGIQRYGIAESNRKTTTVDGRRMRIRKSARTALTLTTQKRYRALLLSVLRSIYDEEGIRGEITEAARRAFRLPRF